MPTYEAAYADSVDQDSTAIHAATSNDVVAAYADTADQDSATVHAATQLDIVAAYADSADQDSATVHAATQLDIVAAYADSADQDSSAIHAATSNDIVVAYADNPDAFHQVVTVRTAPVTEGDSQGQTTVVTTDVLYAQSTSDEIFVLGILNVDSVEIFEIEAENVFVLSAEEFDMLGNVIVNSVEPFNLGTNIRVDSVEPFTIRASSSGYFGPGQPAAPVLGWWDR